MTQPTTGPIGRLLGPAAPEIGCDGASSGSTATSSWSSGADADAELPGFRAHLDGCPACREEHESLLALVSADQG